MSTKTGFAYLENGKLSETDLIRLEYPIRDDLTHGWVQDVGFMFDSVSMAKMIFNRIKGINPDFIYIEQTNLGKNRESQKLLEFIHCSVLYILHKEGYGQKIRYVDTSAWRSKLKVRMTKEDSAHNKLVKAKAIRGKITTKHLAVRWVNDKYDLNLKLKDNDIADAISVATYGFIYEKQNKPKITEKTIEDLFAK